MVKNGIIKSNAMFWREFSKEDVEEFDIDICAPADFSKLHYVMICGCGFPNSKNNFEAMVAQFKLMFPNNHTMITIPENPMFSSREADVVTKPRLELVKSAGAEYAKAYTINNALLQEIGSPMIPNEIYAKICNGEK